MTKKLEEILNLPNVKEAFKQVEGQIDLESILEDMQEATSQLLYHLSLS